jgi:hypothetical protein
MFPGQQMIRDQIPEEPGLLNFYTKLKKTRNSKKHLS